MLLPLLFFALVSFVNPKPAQVPSIYDYIQDDIRLTDEQKQALEKPDSVRSRLYISDKAKHWPNNIVPITFSSNLTTENQQKIRVGLKALEDKTCFRFQDKKPQDKDFVRFDFNGSRGAPCWSRLGRIGGEQPIWLAQFCLDDPEGGVAHEVIHALGVWHEHQRPDRDQYVDVDPEFTKGQNTIMPTKMDLKRFPYDYKSVMHYPGLRLTNKAGKRVKVLYIKGTDTPVPNNKVLSTEDIRKLNELGKCSGNSGTGKQTGTGNTGNSSTGKKPGSTGNTSTGKKPGSTGNTSAGKKPGSTGNSVTGKKPGSTGNSATGKKPGKGNINNGKRPGKGNINNGKRG